MKISQPNLPARCPNCGLSLREAAPGRSNQQNRYFHGVVVPIIAEHLGYDEAETKEILKYKFLKEVRFINTNEGIEAIDFIRSTASLTTIEFEIFNKRIRMWAADYLSVVVPLPNEVDCG